MWPSPVYSHELHVILYALPMPPVASTIAFALNTSTGRARGHSRVPRQHGRRREEPHNGPLHVDGDALVNAVILQRANEFEAGAVADVTSRGYLCPPKFR